MSVDIQANKKPTVNLNDYFIKTNNNNMKKADDNEKVSTESPSTASTTMSSTSTSKSNRKNDKRSQCSDLVGDGRLSKPSNPQTASEQQQQQQYNSHHHQQQQQHHTNNNRLQQYGYAKNDADAIAKIATLESIDRLSRHIPNIVIDQIVNATKEEKEASEQQQQGQQGTLPGLFGEGNHNPMMTLEVPSTVTASNDAIGDNSGHSRGGGASLASSTGRNMNDLLNTLESLDELLNDEFDSDTSNSEGGDADDDDDDDDDDAEGMDLSGKCFHDSISDMDDDESQRNDDVSDDKEGEDSSNSSSSEEDANVRNRAFLGNFTEDFDDTSDYSDNEEFRAFMAAANFAQRMPISRRTSEVPGYTSDHNSSSRTQPTVDPLALGRNHSNHSGNGPYAQRIGRSLSPQRGFSPSRRKSPSRGYSPAPGRRSRSPASDNTQEKEVGKLKQGRLVARRMDQVDAVSDERSSAYSQGGDQTILTASTKQGEGTLGTQEVLQTRHTSAILFVDISGFTKLSRSLEVEPLSKVSDSSNRNH